MNMGNPIRRWRLLRVVRIVRARPRLFLAALCGMVVIGGLPGEWRLTTRLLLGWDAGVSLYLMAVLAIMARADVARIRRHAALQDEGRITILVLVVAAAIASLGAIVAQLGEVATKSGGRPAGHLVLSAATIVLSWIFVHAIFALHYAHEYYDADDTGNGLSFPHPPEAAEGTKQEPDYWDFLYFSLVIGMTSQVSD